MTEVPKSTALVFKLEVSGTTTLSFKDAKPLHKSSTTLKFSQELIAPSTTLRFSNDVAAPNILVSSVAPTLDFGNTTVRQGVRAANTTGFLSYTSGLPEIANLSMQVIVSGIPIPDLARPEIYNHTQYINHLNATNNDQAAYGRPYMQGGVRSVKPNGFVATAMGVPLTGVPFAKPSGFSTMAMGSPIVRPHIIYMDGISSLKVGTHKAGFQPAIQPDGHIQTIWGGATAWYHTRAVAHISATSMSMGYPVVSDSAQNVRVLSLVASAVFGDTYVKNYNSNVSVSSIVSGDFSPWAVIENTNRYFLTPSIDSLLVGAVEIYNKTPSVFVIGIKQQDTVMPEVSYRLRTVTTVGVECLVFGWPVLKKTPQLFPMAFQGLLVGSNSTVTHKIRIFEMIGFDALLAGKTDKEPHVVWFKQRRVMPASWFSSSLISRTVLTHQVRELVGRGSDSSFYGRPWISAGQRTISPQGVYREFPSSHLVGRLQVISVEGYIATLFGTRIIPESHTVYPLGIAAKFGDAVIGFYKRYLKALGFSTHTDKQVSERWGNIHAFNSVQYITQNFDGNSGLVPQPWVGWTLIENKNKSIGPVGFSSHRFGYSVVSNNAAPLLLVGIEPPVSGRFEQALISHAIREVSNNGIEPPPISPWLALHNSARVVWALGVAAATLGSPLIASNRRYFNGIGGLDGLMLSQPMISHAIRTVDIESRYSIFPPQINLPIISNYVKYVEVLGVHRLSIGSPDLVERFNIISPRWRYNYNMGDPYIRNSTPEIATYGHSSNEFGLVRIRTQWRNIITRGDAVGLWGKPSVLDRTKTIAPRGWIDTVSNQKLVVIRLGAPAYSEQRITLQGFGIKVPDLSAKYLQVPPPILNQNVLYVFTNKESTLFGDTVVSSNILDVIPGISQMVFGGESKVFLVRQEVFLSSTQAIDSAISAGRPRLSPHTIWAPKEAPYQAVVNHPFTQSGIKPHYVDENGKGVGVAFGKHGIANQHRVIWARPASIGNQKIGLAEASLADRVISCANEGISPIGAGHPKIPFTDQSIRMNDKGASTLLMGQHLLRRQNNELAGAGNIPPLPMPKPSAQLRNMLILIRGWASESMGKQKVPDNPFMWQGLRIGEHVPTSISGSETLVFSEPTVSLRVRGVEVSGFSGFSSEYDVNSFSGRMKVSRVIVDEQIQSHPLGHQGFDSLRLGVFDIRNNVRYIKPDGNSEQFRKGAW